MKYWLMKTEPNEFSIDDLKRKNREQWDGVRNYQVRNMMRDEMRVGDLALMYHSNAGKETGVVGVMEVAKVAYPDPTQFDSKSAHPDPKSDTDNPRWLCVDVKFISKFPRLISLQEMNKIDKLKHMKLLQKGNRLSMMSVEEKDFMIIKDLSLE